MATRFYLPSSGAAAVTPAWSAGWEQVASGSARRCATARQNTAMASGSLNVASPQGTLDFGLVRYVSDPLQAQAIAGTVKGQIRAAEGDSFDDCRAQLVVKIVSGDGATLRGVLLDFDASPLASEFSIALANRRFSVGGAAALDSVNALAGDRLVLELGARTFDAYGFSRKAILRFGDAAASDLPEDEVETAELNPWIELSQNLLFQAAGGGASVTPIAMQHYRKRRVA